MLEKFKRLLMEENDFKKVIIRDTLIFSIGELLLKIMVFISFVIVWRKLWLNDFWNLNFLTTFIGFFVVLSDFGTNTLLFKEMSENKDNRNMVNDILNIKKVLLVASFLLCVFVYIILWFDVPISLLFIALFYLLAKYVWDSCKIFYRWNNNFKKEFQLKMVELGVIFFMILFFYLKYELTIHSVLLSYLFSQILVSYFYIKVVKSDFKINLFNFEFKDAYFDIIKRWFFYWWWGLLASINFSFDQILLKYFWFTEELWIYAWSFKIISIGLMFISYIFIPIFPHLVRSSKSWDLSHIKQFNHSFIRYILIFSLLTAPLVFLFSESFLLFLFWENFLGGWIYLSILYISFLFIFLREPAWYTLTAINKPHIMFNVLLSACLLNITLNLVIIPTYGALWASITTLITEFVTFLLYLFYLRKYIYNKIDI
jgi:O-antigen/teichoic acid export membrane protein